MCVKKKARWISKSRREKAAGLLTGTVRTLCMEGSGEEIRLFNNALCLGPFSADVLRNGDDVILQTAWESHFLHKSKAKHTLTDESLAPLYNKETKQTVMTSRYDFNSSAAAAAKAERVLYSHCSYINNVTALSASGFGTVARLFCN